MQGKLKYKIVSYSSEDQPHPVSNLLVKGSTGWESGRFCNYPQQITLQFYSQVHVKQLQFLSNCRKIASRIDILYYSDSKDNVESRFTKYGYVQLSSNEQTNYEGREQKTIMVDLHCTYMRFLLHKPHPNKQNFFSQVGLHEINVIGEGFDVLSEPVPKNPMSIDAQADDRSIEDEFIHSKLVILTQLKDQAAKSQNFDEAKRIKEIIGGVRSLGYQIRGLEDKKREAVDSEDYDKAQKIKVEIERIRSSADAIISGVHNPNFRAKTVAHEENLQTQQLQLEKSRVSSKASKEVDNQFVEDVREIKRINYDDRVLPTHMGKQKTEIREDQPPPQTNDILPAQPEPLTQQKQKEGAMLISLFDQKTVRLLYSKHWQFRLEALKLFINETRSPNLSKGKEQGVLFKVYMNIVRNTIDEKVVQICTHSFNLLQELLTINKKIHNEAKIHQFQADADHILLEVVKRMNQNNVKLKGLADQVFRKMTESGLYGVQNCAQALMKVGNQKISAKQYKSKLDTLTYLVTTHGVSPHGIPFSVIDFAINLVDFQSAQVRNSAIDLLVEASLNGAQERVKIALEKVQGPTKEMIVKKMSNAQNAKQNQVKKGGKQPKK